MLKKILKRETCAGCRICCIYDDSDVWDAPGFTEKEYNKAKDKTEALFRKRDDGLYYLQMEKDSDGIYTCPCLSDKGCTLGEDKPFRCRLWPLYLIRTENGLGIALSPVCPEVWKCKAEDIFEGIRERIPSLLETAKEDPSLVEKWNPEYRMIALPDEAGVYHYLPDEEGTDIRLYLRDMSATELQNLYERELVYDFPEDELKKLDLMIDLKNQGKYDTYAFFDRGVYVGYAFFDISSTGKKIYLFDYLGVTPSLRGKGYATMIVGLIKSHFAGKAALAGEVEDPFMTDDPELKRNREKLMNFYISNGWQDTGISMLLFGVDYRILCRPGGETIESMELVDYYRRHFIEMVGEAEFEGNMKINSITEI